MSFQEQTPLMRQYWSIKSQHKDKILLFRMGDFYEMFFEDAQVSAPILNITLTSRNKKQQDQTPMCGFPYHSLGEPVGKLLTHGYKVAICDQVEEPAKKQGLVRREVTQILTPGMVYDPETLDQLSANYLCAFDEQKIAFWDISTGEAFYYEYVSQAQKSSLLSLLSPVELVLTPQQKDKNSFKAHITVDENFEVKDSIKRLLLYVGRLKKTPQEKVFQKRHLDHKMQIQKEAFRHLEIFKNSKEETKGSLFSTLNATKTPMGARCLKSWLRFPLTDKRVLEERFDAVEKWLEKKCLEVLPSFQKTLRPIGDLERKLFKVLQNHCSPRDMIAFGEALRQAHKAYQFLEPAVKPLEIQQVIGKTMVDLEEAPLNVKEGGFIRKGVLEELDQLIQLTTESQKLLSDLELKERQRAQIPSLKIKYNNVFGYFIEVTKTYKDKVPSHYQVRQTLAQVQRYVTKELCDLEEKILTAHAKRVKLEKLQFEYLKKEVRKFSETILEWSAFLGKQDVLSSFAWLSLERGYVRPELGGDVVDLLCSRHPVVELQTAFTPNHICIQQTQAFLLTGPNMAGKSTLMRQVALSVLMAQSGCFVPAEKAKLPIYKKLFTRIGANDLLAEGLSTFMVEMSEAGEILNNADKESLVIIDEVGRGTSTYDGMSLAQAILEFLVSQTQATVFFATHYHELSLLAAQYSQIQNVHMAIDENTKKLSFLYTLRPGAANRSYGIQVAELAGLPLSVTEKAKEILLTLERNSNERPKVNKSGTALKLSSSASPRLQPELQALEKAIKSLNVQKMTPLEALNWLGRWQSQLQNHKS